ncbi:hypothetical protein CLIB1423_09S01024 [[Candida] railenensis]|uniref:Uncharacterized protein n=1 Tax=[Candida] railenensis TaxID=45579 RepID=A0A9P0QQW9_9ASCO|nr:hypothetical protein CLIB1423_09S01024 [[Candida] railenensis]
MTFLSNRSSKRNQEELPSYDDHQPNGDVAPAYSNEKNGNNEKLDSKKDDVPVVDLEPIVFDGKVVDWDFMVYNENFSHDILTFVSQDARAKYKAFKGSEGKNFDRALDLQREGFAMPLLKAEHHSLARLHSTKYMTIYKYTPPPAAENRLFDKSIDRYVFCEVTKERCASYYKYKLTFTPDPKNPKNDFSLFMIDHQRYPIFDISTYKGRRFRFVYGHTGFRCKWSYELNAIHDGEPSLTDDISIDGKVNKNNPLLGNAWKNNLVPSTKFRSDFPGARVGVALETSEYFHSLQLHFPVRFAFQDLMNNGADVNHTESINSISTDSLVFLCMVSIFKREEDHKERKRRSNNGRRGSRSPFLLSLSG